jgi:hypothetical protein
MTPPASVSLEVETNQTPATSLLDEHGNVIEGDEGDEADEAEAIADALETVSSDAVEIARIEANKEIAVAAIHAEVETARLEGDDQWQEMMQTNIQELQSGMQELRVQLSAVLSAPMQSQVEPEPVAVEVETLTPQSTSDETSETRTVVTAESVEEKPVQKRGKRRGI